MLSVLHSTLLLVVVNMAPVGGGGDKLGVLVGLVWKHDHSIILNLRRGQFRSVLSKPGLERIGLKTVPAVVTDHVVVLGVVVLSVGVDIILVNNYRWFYSLSLF